MAIVKRDCKDSECGGRARSATTTEPTGKSMVHLIYSRNASQRTLSGESLSGTARRRNATRKLVGRPVDRARKLNGDGLMFPIGGLCRRNCGNVYKSGFASLEHVSAAITWVASLGQ